MGSFTIIYLDWVQNSNQAWTPTLIKLMPSMSCSLFDQLFLTLTYICRFSLVMNYCLSNYYVFQTTLFLWLDKDDSWTSKHVHFLTTNFVALLIWFREHFAQSISSFIILIIIILVGGCQWGVAVISKQLKKNTI